MTIITKTRTAENVSNFMQDFHAMTDHHPFAGHLSVLDNYACFEIKPFDGKILFCYITTIERGKGHGTKALRWLTDLADKHGVNLVGQIQRMGDHGLTTVELRRWYKRHGFKVDRQLNIVRAAAQTQGDI